MIELGFVLDAPLWGGVDTKSNLVDHEPWSIACHVGLFIHSNFLGPLDLQAPSVTWCETISAFYNNQIFRFQWSWAPKL